ncbi:hypothetical protein HZ994_00475 [Akkermansiaceae bacterium]|nr:hypothetical protein HZ994_00475 [Akkermansiaceae bacterium]
MTAAIPLLVLTGVSAGPLLARLGSVALRRSTGWLLLAAIIVAADFAVRDVEPLWRMVAICCVLLGGMKGLVYAEWAGSQPLPLPRYGIFAFLWFGMDPGSFRVRRNGLSWKRDTAIGLLLMLIGTLGAWLVWAMAWRNILVMFLPMSLGFHFGALRVLKGGLRSAGFPVRTLFPNPLETQGTGDFWSRRWNTGYSQMMQRCVGRPCGALLGENAGIMAVFVISGLLHELAITLPVRSGFGLPTLFFTLHGLLAVVERKRGRPLGKIPAFLAVALPLGWLFPPDFQTEVIAKCLGIFELSGG